MNSRPLAPDNTAALGLDAGELVEVHSRHGAMVLAVRPRSCAASKLTHRRIEVAADTREAFVVAEAQSGHSFHIVPAGAALTAAESEHCMTAICDAAQQFAYLVISGSVPPGMRADFCAEVVRRMRPYDTRIMLDIAGAQLREVLHERAFLIRLDRREASALVGRPIDSFAAARAANDHLLGLGAADHAITTVGALGAVYSDHLAHHQLSAPPPPLPPRSDACAGDSLIGALTYRLTEGDPCLRACEYGVAAAAATVLLPGTEIFQRSTVDALVGEVRTQTVVREIGASSDLRPGGDDKRPDPMGTGVPSPVGSANMYARQQHPQPCGRPRNDRGRLPRPAVRLLREIPCPARTVPGHGRGIPSRW
ncbi:PfkB family carbohydrate kinase [Nocardia vinacea]|uniref:PfkB family carbohydrate kinase n=1 Tax=Nocardia vinacea TaxID=96468 RepID=UPI00031F2929|nr:PfkB family carbohydrate kinase [Nocardia vinacea]